MACQLSASFPLPGSVLDDMIFNFEHNALPGSLELAYLGDSLYDLYVREHLIAALHCAAVVCGFNFRFGYRGAGTSSDLSRLLAEANVPLTVIDPVTHEDTPVSSTRIREEKLIGQSYLQQLRRGELVSWKILNIICSLLECQPGDLIEYVEA